MAQWIIRNATVFCGEHCELNQLDVEICDGRIGRIGKIESTRESVELDATGMYLSAGWIDLHVHVFDGIGLFSIPPGRVGMRRGVTTLLDAGTAGALTCEAFSKFVCQQSAERIYGLLNISLTGAIHGFPTIEPLMGELCDARYADTIAALKAAGRFSESIVGFKVRLTDVLADNCPEKERKALQAVVRASRESGLPFMVHHHSSNLSPEEVLGVLRAGDILTHLYNPSSSRPFSSEGRPLDCLLEARQRGALFDVGHGIGSFSWDVAEAACLEHGVWPDTISTDAHTYCLKGPVFDLATTLTKFLHLGMPLSSVIAACTKNAARAMGKGHRHGVVESGREADLTLFRLEAGNWPLYDVHGDVRFAKARIRPEHAFVGGLHFHCAEPPLVIFEDMELVATRAKEVTK